MLYLESTVTNTTYIYKVPSEQHLEYCLIKKTWHHNLAKLTCKMNYIVVSTVL